MRWLVITIALALFSCRGSQSTASHVTTTEQRTAVSDSVCVESQSAESQTLAIFESAAAEVVLTADSAVMPDGSTMHGLKAHLRLDAPKSQKSESTAITIDKASATSDSLSVRSASDQQTDKKQSAGLLSAFEIFTLLCLVGVFIFTFITFRNRS